MYKLSFDIKAGVCVCVCVCERDREIERERERERESHLKPLLSLQHAGEDSWTRRGAGCRRTLCLCMKSCGGVASVVAGGTKVWMRRNGHQGEMESSFRGGRHAHTCAGCLHWAGTLHADAFQRSRWAHQIRIHVFTLDFSLPKRVYMCVCDTGFCTPSWDVKAESSLAS